MADQDGNQLPENDDTSEKSITLMSASPAPEPDSCYGRKPELIETGPYSSRKAKKEEPDEEE